MARQSMRSKVFEVLEGRWEANIFGRLINWFMVALITSNVALLVIGSMQSVHSEYGEFIDDFNLFAVIVFTVEYALRLWSCVDHPTRRYAHPVIGRLKFALAPMSIIDFLAIAPLVLAFLHPLVDLMILRVFRLVRLLKLSRYFPAMHMIGNVVYDQRRALMSAFFLMVVMLILSSSIMFMIERKGQPEAFSSIPAAMWWGMSTLTTVGYGDVTPLSPLGKFVGVLIAIFGIGMFALPAAIMASGFIREMERQSFMVSWQVVAKLPLFSGLNGSEIGEIANLLRPSSAIPGEILFHKGDPADGVYFLQTGHVSIQIDGQRFHLGPGDFFGEIALLRDARRMGTARAESSCRLLVLGRRDFEDPDIRAHERGGEAADRRTGGPLNTRTEMNQPAVTTRHKLITA